MDYLKKSIESIVRQSYSNIELIVSDDGSSDGTIDYLSLMQGKNNLNFKVLFNQHIGPGMGRRLALDYVTGDLLVFLDDDDYYTDFDFFRKSAELFNKYNDLSVAMWNSTIKFEETGVLQSRTDFIDGIWDSVIVLDKFMMDFPKPHSTFPSMFKANHFIQSEGLNMKTLNDTQIYLRALLFGKSYYSKESVGVYRVHGGSIGKNLSYDFIEDNLVEKMKMFHKLPAQVDKNNWIFNQLKITIDYYALSTEKFRFIRLIKWIINNNIPTVCKFKLLKSIAQKRIRFRFEMIKYSLNGVLKRSY